jgi:hypothetical protein
MDTTEMIEAVQKATANGIETRRVRQRKQDSDGRS